MAADSTYDVSYKLDLKVKVLEYIYYHCSHVCRLKDEKLEPEDGQLS